MAHVADRLGVPLVLGFLTRTVGERRLGREAYEARVLPRIGPWALYGLLFTVVVLFGQQGRTITSEPGPGSPPSWSGSLSTRMPTEVSTTS